MEINLEGLSSETQDLLREAFGGKPRRKGRKAPKDPICPHYFPRGTYAECNDPDKKRWECRCIGATKADPDDGISSCAWWPPLRERHPELFGGRE
jgi:hypothetical protein